MSEHPCPWSNVIAAVARVDYVNTHYATSWFLGSDQPTVTIGANTYDLCPGGHHYHRRLSP